MDKEEDLKFIKKFTEISVIKICQKLKIDKSNLYSGRASADATNEVVKELKKELKKLMQ